MNIILFGFKASGKTYFGQKLAKLLQKPFFDVDDLICQATAFSSIREVYQHLQEENFRSLEQNIIFSLEKQKNSVIALGGGSVNEKKTVLFLQNIGTLVYLKASFETVKQRILTMKQLPSLIDPKNPVSSLLKIYEKRIPIYEKIPAIQIDTDQFNTEQVLQKLTNISYGI